MATGELYIVSAPSGAGKTTLVRHVFADPRVACDLHFSVSHTTRAPRRGERDGSDYHFVDLETFDRMVEEDRFLEWAEVHGNRYGTSVDEVLPRLEAGTDVMLDIDVQGADQVAARFPDSCRVFIAPPSYEALRERLRGRGLDRAEDIDRRLAVSRREIECYERYDYVILNRDARRSGEALAAIILGRRHRLARMRERAEAVLENFKQAIADLDPDRKPR